MHRLLRCISGLRALLRPWAILCWLSWVSNRWGWRSALLSWSRVLVGARVLRLEAGPLEMATRRQSLGPWSLRRTTLLSG